MNKYLGYSGNISVSVVISHIKKALNLNYVHRIISTVFFKMCTVSKCPYYGQASETIYILLPVFVLRL